METNSKKVFINFSNHRTENWGEEQLAAAKSYGEIIDFPFPYVDPDGDENYILGLAEEYVEKLTSLMEAPCISVVHIMGELTLTHHVVGRLKWMGVKCVASTTERKVVELEDEDGEVVKIAIFKFRKFREY